MTPLPRFPSLPLVRLIFAVQLLLLVACGGGSGSGSSAEVQAGLSSLDLQGHSLDQSFVSTQLNYSASVDYYTDSVAISYGTTHPGAQVSLTNAAGAALTAASVPLNEGTNRINIRVTTADGSPGRSYVLDIARETFAEFARGYPASQYYQPEKLSAPIYEVRVEQDVYIPMRDGVTLAADIYHPIGAGPFPTLLQRTPYNKRTGIGANNARFFASRGYVVVTQDTRGRYDSGGNYYPYRHEIEDGYDTNEWIGIQTWSNGKIGTYGGSYVGLTQIAQALAGSQYLTAIAPDVTTSDTYNQWTYVDGAFHYGFTLPWGAIFMGGSTNQSTQNYDMRHLPIDTADAAAGSSNQSYRDWLAHPRRGDSYWDNMSFEDRIHQISVPMLSIAGWYDIFLRGTVEDDVRVRTLSPHQSGREGKRMLIGPWTHLPRGRVNAPNRPTTGPNRTPDFGAAAEIDMRKVHLRWYDHWLKGVDNGVGEEPPILLFVMGENVWRYEAEWPLARTQYSQYYLQSNGAANSAAGNGVLTTALPVGADSDSFVYDPANPVPTGGGNVCCGPVPEGPWNQAAIEQRQDVLVFSTPVLTEAVEVTGPIKVKLYASSSAADTDWTAKLVDVHPDGYALNIQDGIVRARYRNGKHQLASLLTPGQIYEYEIDLWASSNVFLPGHRIRLEISSSNFPRFDRNLNTGEDPATGVRMETAQQRVYHSAQYPSHILLPVIPRN